MWRFLEGQTWPNALQIYKDLQANKWWQEQKCQIDCLDRIDMHLNLSTFLYNKNTPVVIMTSQLINMNLPEAPLVWWQNEKGWSCLKTKHFLSTPVKSLNSTLWGTKISLSRLGDQSAFVCAPATQAHCSLLFVFLCHTMWIGGGKSILHISNWLFCFTQ